MPSLTLTSATPAIRRIHACRACGNTSLLPVMNLGRQSLTGRFVKPGEPDPLAGPIEVVLCHGDDPAKACGLLQLAHDYPPEEMYGPHYGYRSSNNASMVSHLAQITREARAWTRLKPGDAVLDIGCNDGALLGAYGSLEGVRRVGVDPSSGRFAGQMPTDVDLIVDFFSARRVREVVGQTRLRIITSVAMFYDLADPLNFMRQVRDLLAKDGVWVTEQAHLLGVLQQLAYDGMCHEHLAYYNLRQISWLASRAGLRVLDVTTDETNGSSFRVTLCRDDSPLTSRGHRVAAVLTNESRAGCSGTQVYFEFAQRAEHRRRQIINLLAALKAAGRTPFGYGASTKGNVILQHCGLTRRDLPGVAEKYAAKFGLETPGTRIPIVSEDQAREAGADAFVVLPWHFRDEIIERERAFLEDGGWLIFLLPELTVVTADAAVPAEAMFDTVEAPPVPGPVRRSA